MYLQDVTMSMLAKFFAIIIVTPLYVIPSIAVAAAGGACGQVYIKAQLSVKREMANAKAPVMAQCVSSSCVSCISIDVGTL